jgi:hypothetical protein
VEQHHQRGFPTILDPQSSIVILGPIEIDEVAIRGVPPLAPVGDARPPRGERGVDSLRVPAG